MPKVTRLPITRYDLPSVIDHRGYKVGAEIGVDHGYFSYYLLKHSHLELLWSIDSFRGKWAPLLDDACSYLLEFGDRSEIVPRDSLEVATVWSNLAHKKGVHFAYLDSDHRYKWIKAEIAAWSQLILPGGMLAGHDYIEADGCGVIQAVNEFADARGLEVSITREPWATWMVTL